MATTRPWTVNHPGPLTQRDEGLWTVDDEVPGLRGATRRMTVLGRLDGTVLFFNAVPVDELTLEKLRALGKPAALIIPNQYHALDAPAFAHRLGLTAYCPDIAVEVLAPRLACQPISALPAEQSLRIFRVDGFRTHEIALVSGKTLIVGDLLTNAPNGKGFTGFMMKLVGFTGPAPKLPMPVRRRVGRDLAAVRGLMNELAGLEGLERIIPSHGDVVETNARQTLRAVAQTF